MCYGLAVQFVRVLQIKSVTLGCFGCIAIMTDCLSILITRFLPVVAAGTGRQGLRSGAELRGQLRGAVCDQPRHEQTMKKGLESVRVFLLLLLCRWLGMRLIRRATSSVKPGWRVASLRMQSPVRFYPVPSGHSDSSQTFMDNATMYSSQSQCVFWCFCGGRSNDRHRRAYTTHDARGERLLW
jgi:hypothetical protein